jgi:hypothetical protein
VLGEEHPETLSARANLADMLTEIGELDEARLIMEEVVEALSRVLGEEHPETLSTRSRLAATLRKLGQLREARIIGEEVVEALSRLLGEEHPQTLYAMLNLAATLNAEGRETEANTLLASSLAIGNRLFGRRHTITTQSAWQLLQSCGPHEANRRKAIILEHFSWLRDQRPDQLTAEQKKIKIQLKGSLPGGKAPKRPRKKKHRK